MAVTIRDVALKAGVSFQLVAAVLGKKKYAHASAATREKIFAAAESLGYVPNAHARILRGDASKIIGVLIDSRAPVAMYSILAEIEQLADAHGYRILSAQTHDNPEKLLQSYYALKQNGVDGVISFSHDYSQFGYHLDKRLQDDPKIVFVLNTDEQNTSAVDIDMKDGIIAAAEHLRNQGYKKTAFLLFGEKTLKSLTQGNRDRLAGIRQGCPEGDIILLKTSSSNIEELEKECCTLLKEKLLPEKFDSVIALNDFLALIFMNQLMLMGIRIPQEFGIVGCDNLPFGMCYPVKLTTLNYDRKKLAQTTFKVMLDKINGNTDPVRVNIPMELIVRESSSRKNVKKAD